MTLTKATMDRIGRKHSISPAHRKEFLKWINDDVIDNDKFCLLLNLDPDYVAAAECVRVAICIALPCKDDFDRRAAEACIRMYPEHIKTLQLSR